MRFFYLILRNGEDVSVENNDIRKHPFSQRSLAMLLE